MLIDIKKKNRLIGEQGRVKYCLVQLDWAALKNKC